MCILQCSATVPQTQKTAEKESSLDGVTTTIARLLTQTPVNVWLGIIMQRRSEIISDTLVKLEKMLFLTPASKLAFDQ